MVTLVDQVRDSLANQLKATPANVQKVWDLLSSGLSPAYIARYLGDDIGGLSNSQVASVVRAMGRSKDMENRRAAILKSVDGHDRLTPEHKSLIESSTNLQQLEDLYLPYKRRKPSKFSAGSDKAVRDLAAAIQKGSVAAADLDVELDKLIDAEARLPDREATLAAVRSAIAEEMSFNIEARKAVRDALRNTGKLVCKEFVEPNAVDAPKTEPATADSANDEAKPSIDSTLPSDSSANGSESAAKAESESDQPATDVKTSDHEAAAKLEPAADDASPAEDNSVSPPNADAGKAASEEKSDAPANVLSETATATKPKKKSPAKPASANTAELRRQQRRESRQRKREHLRASFKPYFDYSETLPQVKPPKLLAINRGERVRVLEVTLESDEEALREKCDPILVPAEHPHKELLAECAKQSFTKHILPGVDRDLRRELTDRAERHAVRVFSRNMRELLLQPPTPKRILAIDPGLRYGCKAVALDARGKLLGETTVHALGDADRVSEGRRRMAELVQKHDLEIIAIGNGTGVRQAETTVATMLSESFADRTIHYTLVNESGTSVYSTGALAIEELPEADARARAAVAIGRRLIDPISELVKVEPDQIGSGAYQQDVKLKHLQEPLINTIRDCVNEVGVDVNTASPCLLRFVSGLDEHTADVITQHRLTKQPFATLEDLKQVTDVSDAIWKQAAGFLRIFHGDEPLDATAIHPDHYESARKLIADAGLTSEQLADEVNRNRPKAVSSTPATPAPPAEPAPQPAAAEKSETATEAGEAKSEDPTAVPAEPQPAAAESTEPAIESEAPKEVPTTSEWTNSISKIDVAKAAESIGRSPEFTTRLLNDLRQPGRDCRLDRAAPIMRRNSLRWEDLEPGLELFATVLSVVDFGAFVDLGIRESGLVHISELANHYIQDPHEVVSVGDSLRLWVLSVDADKRRVSLSALSDEQRKARSENSGKQRRGGRPGDASKKRGERGSGKPRGGGRGGRNQKSDRASKPRSFEVKPKRRKPKAPAVPITDAMKEGKEPMRTFGDLAQFFTTDKADDKKKTEKGGKKK